jgi:hypothetical protein
VTFSEEFADTNDMTQMANLYRLLGADAADDFWNKVDVRGPDECWPWAAPSGVRERSGHVRAWFRGTRTYVHRIGYLLSGGVIAEGELVLHSCDNPPCCNPRHLRAGDALANARDRDSRDRRTPLLPRGEAHWSAKLSNLDARRIRKARALGVPAEDLALTFEVCRATNYNVLSGATYTTDSPATMSDSFDRRAAEDRTVSTARREDGSTPSREDVRRAS